MGSEVGAGIRRSQPIALSLLLWIVDTWSLLVPRPLFPTCYNELAGRRSLGVERLWQHHRLGNHDGNNTSIAAPTAAAPRRRQKKNKYAKFSKVAETTIDPLEALLQESKRLNRELMEEQQREEEQKKRSRPQPEIKPLPKLEFPDTQTIDVSLFMFIVFQGVERSMIVSSRTDPKSYRNHYRCVCFVSLTTLKPLAT